MSDLISPTTAENGRIVVFRGCWNMAPLVTAFESLGYETWVDRPDAELRQLRHGDVVTCDGLYTKLYRMQCALEHTT